MRSEPELYKDKIEVSLDGRQIFYLFFGGAVIACLVFVLGVLVGKRVEARAHTDHPGTSAARDPLAALDALDATSHATTPQPAPPAGQMERAVADLEGAQKQARAAAAAPAPAPAKPPVVVADEDPAPVAKPADDKKEEKKKDEKKADEKKKKDDDAAEPAAKPVDDKIAKKDDAKKDVKRKARYTLQLSSFQDKGEAQAFLDSVKGAGYAPYLVEADVDGKGTFYRVRLGTYPSYDDAIDAKSEFEAKVKKVAYVTKL
ncbi:MAG TPA: SPOR domain-containing protein [Kofleriaceae bacterium]|nr:SPOR domain-containing protein [Kofleriaceae bacterium]